MIYQMRPHLDALEAEITKLRQERDEARAELAVLKRRQDFPHDPGRNPKGDAKGGSAG